MEKSFKQLLRESFKSEDTEEWLDVHFTRPIGLAFALMWKRLHVHPNVITFISMILGVGAGCMFYYTDLQHNIMGVILLMFANFCDSTDGQLARLTGQKTLIGRMLDGFSGDVWFLAIYLAIVFRIWNTPIPFTDIPWSFGGLIICCIAGFICHSMQCSLADYYRQIHLYFLLGKNGSELDNYESQKKIYDNLPNKGAFWDHKFYFFYMRYCHGQEKKTPAFQQFFKHMQSRYLQVEDIPQELRDEFRKGSLPLMKYTNLLTFNTRAITLYIACLLNIPYVYPLVEIIIFSMMYYHMHNSHETLCKRLDEKYCQ